MRLKELLDYVAWRRWAGACPPSKRLVAWAVRQPGARAYLDAVHAARDADAARAAACMAIVGIEAARPIGDGMAARYPSTWADRTHPADRARAARKEAARRAIPSTKA